MLSENSTQGPYSAVIIDDDDLFIELVEDTFSPSRINIRESFTNPLEALEFITGEHTDIDCVISDYEMPRMNGLELLTELRDTGNNIPFILLTEKGGKEVAAKTSFDYDSHYFVGGVQIRIEE